MIRSGSTFQYNLASQIVERYANGQREGYFEAQEFEAFRQSMHLWAADDSFHVLKSHEWIPLRTIPGERVKFLYVYRDPVDIANSARKKWGHTIEQSMTSIDKSLEVFTSLSGDQRALIQSYEQLTKNTAPSVEAIAQHLNITLDSSACQEIADRNKVHHAGQSMRSTQASWRKRFMRFARSRGLTAWIGRFLRKLRLSDSIYYRIRRLSSDYDSKSLYHADHVATDQSDLLSGAEKLQLAERYGTIAPFSTHR